MRRPVVAVLAIAALAVSACASSATKATSAQPAATTGAAGAPASTVATPTGAPIVLAMISQESGPAALPDARQAAQAAVAYVNAELGGAGGRPLKLETCITDGSPEQSSGCANKLLETKPVAFVGEFELGTSGSMPIIERAGVPRIGPAAVTPELLQSPDTFAFGLDLVPGWSAWTQYLTTKLNAKTINIISVDFSGSPIIQQIIKSVAVANGASVGKAVLFPQTATDVSSQMATLIAGSPGAIMAIPSGGSCVPLLQAHHNLAASVPFFVPGICGDPRILKAAGDAAEGTYVGFSRLNPFDTSDPEVATYRRALTTYSKEGVALSEFASNAFSTVINVKDLIDKLGSGVTAESLTNAVRTAKDQKSFMGQTYTCAQANKLTPATCANGQRMLQVKNGVLVDVGGTWFDGTSQAKLG